LSAERVESSASASIVSGQNSKSSDLAGEESPVTTLDIVRQRSTRYLLDAMVMLGAFENRCLRDSRGPR
jgi:hypothetical protein